MSENTDLTYYQRNREVILHKAKDYYENDKERWEVRKKISIETYLKKTKTKRDNMKKDRYHNTSGEKKQKLKEYQRNYCKAKKVSI